MLNKTLRILLFLLVTFWLSNDALAQKDAGQLLYTDEHYPIGKYLEYLEDKKGLWTIDEVTSPALSSRFQVSQREVLNFGFTRSVYWVRFKIGAEETPQDYLIEIAYPLIDQLTIYHPIESGWESETTGDAMPFHYREIGHRNITYKISVPPGTVSTFYLRFQTEGTMQIPLVIWKPESFYNEMLDEYIGFGILYGTLIIIMAYNGFICWILQKRIYLVYVFMTFFSVLFLATLNGHAFKYLWPNLPEWSNQALPFAIGWLSFFITTFSRVMLETKRYSLFFHVLLWALSITGALLVIGSVFMPYNFCIKIGIVNGILSALAAFLGSMISRIKGNLKARYLVPASYLYLIGIFLVALKSFGVIETTFITIHAVELGAIFQAVFYSLALRDKYSILAPGQ